MNISKSLITIANDSTRDRKDLPSAIHRSAGFTLIELLSAVGIIAVLIALLLPVIQRKREEYAQNKAAGNLRILLIASNEYFARTGQYPDELADLSVLRGTPVWSGPLNLLVTTGKAGGYAFDFNNDGDVDGADFLAVDGADFLAIAEPEFPGVTGSVTLTINLNGVINSSPTPGADAARERMFDNIRAKAAETVVNLLRLDANATTEVRNYTESPSTVTGVFQRLDGNVDSRVSIAELGFADTTFDDEALRAPLRGFLDYVAQEMKWDRLDDAERALVTVDYAEMFGVESGQAPLISYDGLCRLTGIWVSQGAPTGALCAKLEEAEAAETGGDRQGKSKAIKAYQKMVKAQIGQTITRSHANTLMTLSKTL